MATASLRELDPPMHHAPFPAGFPLRGESPRLLAEESVTDRSAKHQLRKELAEQEPRYENGRPPYPSGTRTHLFSWRHQAEHISEQCTPSWKSQSQHAVLLWTCKAFSLPAGSYQLQHRLEGVLVPGCIQL